MQEKSDTTLLQQYLTQGNEQALELLVKRHMASVYAFVRRYTGNPDTAADITQEAFVKAWKNLKRFDHTKNFKVWLFAIAKHAAIDELKKKRPMALSTVSEGGIDIAEAVTDTAPSIVDILFGQATAGELATALAKLPDDHRTVVRLHVSDALTFREIADTLKKPLNTVKSQYRRGMTLLKKVFLS